jgi:hypothetical protein
LDDLQDRQALGRKEKNPRPLDMFERLTTVAGDHEQLLAIVSHQNDIDGLAHAARLAHPDKLVNPMSVSVH